MDYTLRNLTEFTLPPPRIEAFKKSPLYIFPKEWNELKAELKCQHNRFTFKVALTDDYFDQMFQEFSVAMA